MFVKMLIEYSKFWLCITILRSLLLMRCKWKYVLCRYNLCCNVCVCFICVCLFCFLHKSLKFVEKPKEVSWQAIIQVNHIGKPKFCQNRQIEKKSIKSFYKKQLAGQNSNVRLISLTFISHQYHSLQLETMQVNNLDDTFYLKKNSNFHL